jgi:hypothetical protein
MTKKHTTLTIEDDIVERAKKMNINISEVTERRLREVVGEVKFNTNDGEECEYCGRKDVQATAKDFNKGLMWLYPYEKWICQTCFNRASKDQSILPQPSS